MGESRWRGEDRGERDGVGESHEERKAEEGETGETVGRRERRGERKGESVRGRGGKGKTAGERWTWRVGEGGTIVVQRQGKRWTETQRHGRRELPGETHEERGTVSDWNSDLGCLPPVPDSLSDPGNSLFSLRLGTCRHLQ